MKGLLILLFVLLLALLLDIQLWLLSLFFVTFIFLSNVSHDDYSFLVGLSPQMTDPTCGRSVISSILPLVLKITQASGSKIPWLSQEPNPCHPEERSSATEGSRFRK